MTEQESQYQQFLDRYDRIIQSGDTAQMERLGEMTKRIMRWLTRYEPDIADQALGMITDEQTLTPEDMEHVDINTTGRQHRLTAHTGYKLRSKVTGKTYTEIDTLDLRRWQTIADPAATVPVDSSTGATAASGKKTTKRKKANADSNQD